MFTYISSVPKKWFAIVLLSAIALVGGFGVSVLEVNASCARHPMDDIWVNPSPDGYISAAELRGSCYEPGEYGKVKFRIGDRQFDWDRLEVLRDSHATDVRVFSNAQVTMEYERLTDGWLKVVTSVNYNGPEKQDFSRTDYLLRVLSRDLSEFSVSPCGIGCITGADVAYVSFVVWAGNSVQAKQDMENMFCAMGGNSHCNPLPSNWHQIDAEIWLKNGTRVIYTWNVNGHYYPISPVWPYPNDHGLIPDPTTTRNLPSDTNQEAGNQVDPSETKIVSTPLPVPTPLANDLACRRPEIVNFYAVELPKSTKEKPKFRLFYEVDGADRVEFYGNRMNPQNGHLDVDKPGYWSVWAKVAETADSCFSEQTIHIVSTR